MNRTATLEGVLLLGAGAVVLWRQETITSIHRRLRRHPAGIITLGALTGAALVHLWLEETS